MLWTISIILALLWGLGMVTYNTLGGFIHVLLGVAIALPVFRIAKGRDRKSPRVHSKASPRIRI